MMSFSDAAKIIANARLRGEKLDTYPCATPANLEEALALQDAVMACLGGTIAGWKIGCTNLAAQAALNTDGPFFGPVPASRLFTSGTKITTGREALRVVEAEVALKLKHDLPPQPNGYSFHSVGEAIGSVHPALELVNRRLPGGLGDGVNWNIADGGLNDTLVLGAGTFDLPLELLPGIEITTMVNGELASSGLGENALGGAQHALHWIANMFSRLGRTLQAGNVVTTGLTTAIVVVNPGDTFEARFSELGSVSATFT